MNDYDDNGPVEPIKPGKKVSRTGDRLLIAFGILLAGASAFFPWYVFFNEDKFGVHVAAMDRTRDLPPGQGKQVFSVSPLAMIDNTKDEKPETAITDPFDAITTATVSSLGEEKKTGTMREEQPFPGKGGFRLLHVANGRALIEDGAGMYMVRVGSILPDNSKLATLEQRQGKWVIVTSSGQVYENAGAAGP